MRSCGCCCSLRGVGSRSSSSNIRSSDGALMSATCLFCADFRKQKIENKNTAEKDAALSVPVTHPFRPFRDAGDRQRLTGTTHGVLGLRGRYLVLGGSASGRVD